MHSSELAPPCSNTSQPGDKHNQHQSNFQFENAIKYIYIGHCLVHSRSSGEGGTKRERKKKNHRTNFAAEQEDCFFCHGSLGLTPPRAAPRLYRSQLNLRVQCMYFLYRTGTSSSRQKSCLLNKLLRSQTHARSK